MWRVLFDVLGRILTVCDKFYIMRFLWCDGVPEFLGIWCDVISWMYALFQKYGIIKSIIHSTIRSPHLHCLCHWSDSRLHGTHCHRLSSMEPTLNWTKAKEWGDPWWWFRYTWIFCDFSSILVVVCRWTLQNKVSFRIKRRVIWVPGI